MSSSPITGTSAHSSTLSDPDSLYSHLARVPDPRSRQGRRYCLTGILALTVAAVLAGSRSFLAIGEFATDLTPAQLAVLGLRSAPGESNLRKLFARLDAAAVDLCLAAWAFTRSRRIKGRLVIAIDGKSLRGARSHIAQTPHLIGALDHRTGIVLAQSATAEKSNEIPAVRDLIATFDPEDLDGAVITIDAMHTQTDTAQAITVAGADYVLTVKGNQPRLRDQLKDLPWKQVPASSVRERTRGGWTTRSIKVLVAPAWISFPGTRQVAQLRRTRTVKGKRTTEVVYLITSAGHLTAPPQVLAAWVRGHWGIENRLHWVRDVTFDEDRSQVRTGTSPRIMATIRNVAISLIRLAGIDNIASAIRNLSRHPDQALNLLLTS